MVAHTAASAKAPKHCSVEGCSGKVLAKQFCCKHYYQFKRHGCISAQSKDKASQCQVEACGKPHYSRGFCSRHYQQLLKKGNPLKSTARRSSKIYCYATGCRETVFTGGFCRLHYIKMRSLEMLAEAFPERVILGEGNELKKVTSTHSAYLENASYDDQLREAYSLVAESR